VLPISGNTCLARGVIREYRPYTMKRITILGAGTTGLVAAYLAARAGWDVTLVEATKDMGGMLGTTATAGDPIERFPQYFSTGDREVLWLIKDLGLDDRVFFSKAAHGVFCDDKTYPLSGMLDLLGFQPLRLLERLRLLGAGLMLSRIDNWKLFEGRSAIPWLNDWVGADVTERFIAPFLQARYGNFGNQLSVAWLAGRLRDKLCLLSPATRNLGYLLGSFETLTQALTEDLCRKGARVVKNAAVVKFIESRGELVGFELNDGSRHDAKKVLATVPTRILAGLCPDNFKSYASSLSKINYLGLLSVLISTREPVSELHTTHIVSKDIPFTNMTAHTAIVDPARYAGRHTVQLQRFYSHSDPIASMDPDSLADLGVSALRRIAPDFDHSHVLDAEAFKIDYAAVCPDLNFSGLIPQVATPIAGLYIANTSHTYPDEPTISNCVRIAAKALEVIGVPHEVPLSRGAAAQVGFGSSLPLQATRPFVQ
jgi:protoporphyrinogen oxidase